MRRSSTQVSLTKPSKYRGGVNVIPQCFQPREVHNEIHMVQKIRKHSLEHSVCVRKVDVPNYCKASAAKLVTSNSYKSGGVSRAGKERASLARCVGRGVGEVGVGIGACIASKLWRRWGQ